MGLGRRICPQSWIVADDGRRTTDHRRRLASRGLSSVVRRPLPRCLVSRGQQRRQHGATGRVLNYAAAGAGGEEALRQAQHPHQPVEDVGLQLGAGRASLPQHPLHAQPGREQFAQDGREGGVGREVGEEVGRLPMGDAGQDDLIDIAHHRRERLARLRRRGRQRGAHLARRDLRQHWVLLDLLVVVGDPVDHLFAVVTEFVGGHVSGHEGIIRRFGRLGRLKRKNKRHAEKHRGARRSAEGRGGKNNSFFHFSST